VTDSAELSCGPAARSAAGQVAQVELNDGLLHPPQTNILLVGVSAHRTCHTHLQPLAPIIARTTCPCSHGCQTLTLSDLCFSASIGVATMALELRKTGIDMVGDMPWGTHYCLFYETKQDLLDILVPYFKTGLENKECCLWVLSNSELITVQEAKAALEQAVPDLTARRTPGSSRPTGATPLPGKTQWNPGRRSWAISPITGKLPMAAPGRHARRGRRLPRAAIHPAADGLPIDRK
jgi:hypothetical protein